MSFRLQILFGLAFCLARPAMADPPALPTGLDDLGTLDESQSSETSSIPSLPEGLGTLDSMSPTEEAVSPKESIRKRLSGRFSGFAELRSGIRLQNDPYSNEATLNEFRLQTQLSGSAKPFRYNLTLDWVADGEADSSAIDLRNGRGWIDPREAWLSTQPLDFLDLKAGRQVVTWGTGDLLFINDLFPKDWQSFILGRDEEYLKAPSDTVKVSAYNQWMNVDFVYTPEFDPDRFITGERISYFDPSDGSLAGKNRIIRPDYPDDETLSLRAHRLFGSAEVSFYFTNGRWTQPLGFDPDANQAIFPRLETIGASWRQPVAGGILNIEAGHYDSLDDPDGDNPNIQNSQTRGLIGYEKELARNLTGSFQYYIEQTRDYSAIESSEARPDRTREVLTARLTKLMMMQNLRLSLFLFYSPSDQDGYIRPSLHYSFNDEWKASLGGNIFFGEANETFFGQLENNTNAYLSIQRYF